MVLGFPLVYVAIMIAALLNPVFTQAYWTPLIGIMMGMNEAVLGSLAKAAPAA